MSNGLSSCTSLVERDFSNSGEVSRLGSSMIATADIVGETDFDLLCVNWKRKLFFFVHECVDLLKIMY